MSKKRIRKSHNHRHNRPKNHANISQELPSASAFKSLPILLKLLISMECLVVAMGFSSLHSLHAGRRPMFPITNPPTRTHGDTASTSTPTFTVTSKRLSQLHVSIVPKHNQNEDEKTAEKPPSALFDVDRIQDRDSNFRVRDMSSAQQGFGGHDNDHDNDYDRDDLDEYLDEGQTYSVPWDTEEEDPQPQDVIDATWSDDEQAEGDMGMAVGLSDRDEDAILTEREDRLFVDKYGNRVPVERCILVGVEDLAAMRKNRRNAYANAQSQHAEEMEVYFTLEESMKEMRDLIETAGMELVGEITQRMNEVNPRTYIGTGKVKDTQELLNDLDSCTVVFDAELSPGQQKSLENAFNKEVIQNDFLGADQIVRAYHVYHVYHCILSVHILVVLSRKEENHTQAHFTFPPYVFHVSIYPG